jgi:hypothetical protein
VVIHSNLIAALALLFTLPIAYAREELVSPARLSVFFPMLDDSGFFYQLLNTIDLFSRMVSDQSVDRHGRSVQTPHRRRRSRVVRSVFGDCPDHRDRARLAEES